MSKISNYKNYIKESLYGKFKITDDTITILNHEYAVKNIDLLNSKYTGWVKLSSYESYFIHVYKFTIRGGERYSCVDIFYDTYYYGGSIDKNSASLNMNFPFDVTKCEGPNMDPIIRISDDDPFGEEDWND